ncbi:YDG domain-containing protein [Anaerovorax odorimutans]|uniref:YDG domain-containing protein n=1 Tax=Anaerovorax odorimutans TaxID=109327 RepID=UPI0004119DF2|nr:YDG domain-containing protein [Anaerovorax odorimutans]
MKKRLLSWLLTLTLVLSLVPGMTITASAWGKTSYDALLNAISNQTLLENRVGGSIDDDDSGYFAIDGTKITNSDSRHAQIASGNSSKDFTFNNPPQSDSSCATFFRIVLKPSETSRMLTFKVNLPNNNGTYYHDGVFRLFIFNSQVPYVDNSAQHSYDPQLSREEYAVGGSKQPEIVGDSKLLPNSETYVQEKTGGGEATFGAVIKPSPEKKVYVYLVYDPARNNWDGGDDSAASRFALNDYNAKFSISDLNLYEEVPDTLDVADNNDYIVRETINDTSTLHTGSYNKKIYYYDEKRPTLELLTLAGNSPYLFSSGSNSYTATKTNLRYQGSGANLQNVSQSGSASGISSALAGLASQGLYLGNATNDGTWNTSENTLTVNGQLSVPLYSATKDIFLTINGENISSITFNGSTAAKKDNSYTLRIPKETYGEIHINTSALSPLKFNTDTTEKQSVAITFNNDSNTLGNSQKLTYGDNLCELLKVTYGGQPVNEEGVFSWSLLQGTKHIDASGMADLAGTGLTERYKVTFSSSSYYGEAELSLNNCAIDKRALTMKLGGELVKQYDGTNSMKIHNTSTTTCKFEGYLSKDAATFEKINKLSDVRKKDSFLYGIFSSPDAGTGINVVINNCEFYYVEGENPILKNYYIKDGSSGNIGTIQPKKLGTVNGFKILPRAYEAGNTKVELIAENLTLSEEEILERDKGKVGVALKSTINTKEFNRGNDNVGTVSVEFRFLDNLELTGENSKNYIFSEFGFTFVKSLVYTETYSPELRFYLESDTNPLETYTATYKGEAIEPYIMTADKRYYMSALKEYCDIEYSNNIEPGTATVTIRNKDQRYPENGKLVFFTTTSANFTIQQLETTEAASLADTNKGSNNWYIGDVTVNAPNGFQISKEIGKNANWKDSLVVAEDMNGSYTYYLKKTADGSVTAFKTIEIKRDSTAPTISAINNSNITDNAATVTVNANDDGSDIASYELSKTSGGSEPTITGGDNGVFNISNLLPNTQYDFTATVKDKAGNVTTQALSFTTEKTLPTAGEPSFDSAVYGTPLSNLTIDSGTSAIAGSWVLDDKIKNADSIYPTVNDTTEYTVVFIPSENSDSYGKLTRKLKPTIIPKELTLSKVTGSNKKYDGKNTVNITNAKLNGIINSDEVYVDTNGLTGTLNGSDAGTYNAINLGNMTLAGKMAGNYTLNQPVEEISTTVEILKADAFTLNSPAIMAKNQDNYTLRLELTHISGYPLAPGGTPVFTVTSSNYNSLSSAAMDGNTLILVTNKMQNYTSDTVIIDVTGMDNYEDSTITVNVDYTDKVPVTVSGVTVTDKSYDGGEISYSGTPVSTSRVDNSEITPSGYNYTWQTASGQILSDPPKNAGDYKLIISVEDNDPDYIGSGVVNFTISKATITITADNKTAYVNEEKPTLTYTVFGLAPNEELKKLPNLTCDSDMGKSNTYTIAVSDASVPEGDNYNEKIIYHNGVLTVSNSSSGGSSGSSGGSSDSAATVLVSSDSVKISLSATVSNGTATISVTDTQLSMIASAAKNTGTIKIDVSGLKVNAIVIPSKVISAVDNASASAGLEAVLSNGTVTLDKTALNAIKDKGDAKISIETVDNAKLSNTQKAVLGTQANTAVVVDVNVYINGTNTSTFHNGNLHVSVPYTLKPGENADSITVWFIKADGTIEPKSGTYSNGKVEFTTDHLSQYLIVSFPFADVDQNTWCYGSVAYAYNNGLFSGTCATTFSPNTAMTRQMIWIVLARMDGRMPADMDEARNWAIENGISDGSNPINFINREQLAAILYRYATYKKYDTTQGGMAIREFVDYDSVSGYAQTPMNWAINAGLIKGSNNKLMPHGDATRAQVAAILMRLIQNTKE